MSLIKKSAFVKRFRSEAFEHSTTQESTGMLLALHQLWSIYRFKAEFEAILSISSTFVRA